MELSSDNRTCSQLVKQKLLLVGMGNYIMSVKHRTFGRHESVGDAKLFPFHIDQMAFNVLTGELFVADNYAHIIYIVNTTSLQSRQLVSRHLGNVSSMGFGK